MILDLQTLSVVTSFVTALLGVLLVFAGVQNRSIRAPMWWGSGHIVNACGLGLMASHGAMPAIVTVDLANALVLLGYSLTWSGTRIFDDRPVRLLFVLLAPAIWLLLCRWPAFAAAPNLRAIVVSTAVAALALLTAQVFWRGRDEPLMSRWPAVLVLLAYAAVLLGRVAATLFMPGLLDESLLGGLSFALLSFGTLLFTVVMAFLQLNMITERTERSHKVKSLIDPLSGVANRPAFLDGAARLLRRQTLDQEPLAFLLFDLDGLKKINEQSGHAVGDAVLMDFAGTAAATLGGDVLFARISGEEFASCVPVGDLDEAFAIADRVRRNFVASAARFAAGERSPSVSVGVTLGCDSKAKVTDLLAAADRALRLAKDLGRNRVETVMPNDSGAPQSAPSIVPIIGPERGPATGESGSRRWRAAS